MGASFFDARNIRKELAPMGRSCDSIPVPNFPFPSP